MHALQVTEIEAARERLLELKRQVSRVYIGDSSAVDLLTVALLSPLRFRPRSTSVRVS